MSVELLERAAAALDDLIHDVVFVGGATVTLWITDPAAPAPRPTKDVDVVVEVFSRPELHRFEARLRDVGFREDTDSGVICRWLHGRTADDELILDVMATDAAIMGFENRWQALAIPHAEERELPSGARIRAVTPPYLLTTKLEAFKGRGDGDHLGSRDLEDVVLLVDGRASTVDRRPSTRSSTLHRTSASTWPKSSASCSTNPASSTPSWGSCAPTSPARLEARRSSCRG